MPIAVTCSACQKKINAPERYAGKRAKCPGCGAAIAIPVASAAPPPPPVAPPPKPFDPLDVLGVPAVVPATPTVSRTQQVLVPCPFCAEMIQPAAVKCRYCGEILDAALKRQQLAAPAGPRRAQDRFWSPGVAAILSLVIPGAGQMYRGSVGAGILWFLFTAIGYGMFFFPGLCLHLASVAAAATGDPYKEP